MKMIQDLLSDEYISGMFCLPQPQEGINKNSFALQNNIVKRGKSKSCYRIRDAVSSIWQNLILDSNKNQQKNGQNGCIHTELPGID